MSKPLLTIRVTTIEAFRAWINADEFDDKPWVNEANVMQTIQGVESYSIKANYGTLGHSIIEGNALIFEEKVFRSDQWQCVGGYGEYDGLYITDHQAAPLHKFRSEHPLMIRETTLSKLYHTRHFDLIVTGTCDHLEGNDMRDTKFKFSSFDAADFIESIQWKLYLDMAGMCNFWFDFFNVTGFNGIEDCYKAHIGPCDSMPVTAYPGMEDDIQTVLEDFADWIMFKDLAPWMAITPNKRKRILAGDSELKKLLV